MQRLRPSLGGKGRVVTGVPGAIGTRAQDAAPGSVAGSGAAIDALWLNPAISVASNSRPAPVGAPTR